MRLADRIFIVVVVLALVGMFAMAYRHRKDPIPNTGRFQPVTPNSAVDTVTGRLCWTYDPLHGDMDPKKKQLIPLCQDIYEGKQ